MILLSGSLGQSFLSGIGNSGIGEVLTPTYLFHLIYLGLSKLFVPMQQTSWYGDKTSNCILWLKNGKEQVEYVLETIWSKHLFCSCVWGKWSQIQAVSLNSSFMFIFVQSRLYQENLETLFGRSNGKGLKKIVNGLVAQICKN